MNKLITFKVIITGLYFCIFIWLTLAIVNASVFCDRRIVLIQLVLGICIGILCYLASRTSTKVEKLIVLHAESKERSLSLANIVHDLRSPLSGIYHISRSIYKKIDDPEINKLQKLVIDSSLQMIEIIDSISEHSKSHSDFQS